MNESSITKMLRGIGLVPVEMPTVSVKFKTLSGWPSGIKTLSAKFPRLTFTMTSDALRFPGDPFVMGCEITGPADQITELVVATGFGW